MKSMLYKMNISFVLLRKLCDVSTSEVDKQFFSVQSFFALFQIESKWSSWTRYEKRLFDMQITQRVTLHCIMTSLRLLIL